MKLFPYYKKQSIELNSFDVVQVQIHQSIIRVNKMYRLLLDFFGGKKKLLNRHVRLLGLGHISRTNVTTYDIDSYIVLII